MRRKLLVAQIIDEIFRAEKHPLGMVGLMIDDEEASGGKVIPVGSTVPISIPAVDWVAPAVISQRGSEIHIIAVMAKESGKGALRRLVNSITANGFTPVIVEPVGDVMPAILKRWKWKPTTRGWGWESVTEWRP